MSADSRAPLHIVLYRPEIPPNTGNAMRLAANTSSILHLIHPLGFALDEARLRRAGLDYKDWADVHQHDSLDTCLEAINPPNLWALTRNGAKRHTGVSYHWGDALLFGPESTGLPRPVLDRPEITAAVRIPMAARSRSLNLSNSVAIVIYEALRQLDFGDLA